MKKILFVFIALIVFGINYNITMADSPCDRDAKFCRTSCPAGHEEPYSCNDPSLTCCDTIADLITPTPDSATPGGPLFTNPSNISTIEELLEKIINFVYAMSFPVLTGIVLYAAFVMMTASGKPEQFNKGIVIIIYAAIGFIVILLSKGFVFIIRSIFD